MMVLLKSKTILSFFGDESTEFTSGGYDRSTRLSCIASADLLV